VAAASWWEHRPAVPDPDDRALQKTYERALNLLSFRDRSAKKLAARLVEKGEPPALVAAAIARLTANGLLDDNRFAAARARSGLLGKARSRRRMEQTLALDGVPREVAVTAIQQVLDEEGTTEVALAVRAARKKLRSLSGHPPPVQRDKLYGFLARQGYGADIVRKTLREVLDVPPPDDDG
jgi:regulatory protein